jgi:triacylglycerol lipase
MPKIKFSAESSKFSPEMAMELANLIERAYQQFFYYKRIDYLSGKTWKPEATRKLLGSTTCDMDLDKPSEDGKVEYKLLSVFKVTEFTLTSSEIVPFGFIVQRELKDRTLGIFIVFRGTLTTDEWYHNARVRQVDFLEDYEFGKVAEGFNTVYSRSVDENYIKNFLHRTVEEWFPKTKKIHFSGHNSLENTIIETLKKCPENSQVFITGHSLGAALATLAAAHITKIIETTSRTLRKPIVYTFASPRVGDKKFAKNFREMECYRIANSEDLVVSIPPSTGRINGEEMQGKPLIDGDNSSAIPSLKNKNVHDVDKDDIKIVAKKFRRNLTKQVYEHIGEPLYFTDQRGALSTNHNMFYIYRKALP